MEIRQLRYLVAASKTRNFSQAAARCFTSRQNLAGAIRELEAELDVKFFRIVGNKPMLTQEGELASQHAERILHDIDEFGNMFADKAAQPAENCELSVLYPVYMRFANDNAYSALGNFSDFPLLLAEQMPDTCYEKVCQGKADVALVYCLTREFPLCESVFLGSSPMRILTSEASPLACRHRIMMADLANYNLLLLPNREFVYQRFIEVFRNCGLDERHIHTMVDYGLMTKQILEGAGVAVSSKTFPSELPQGVISIPFEDIGCEWSLYLLFQRNTDRHQQIGRLLNYLENDPKIASLAAR